MTLFICPRDDCDHVSGHLSTLTALPHVTRHFFQHLRRDEEIPEMDDQYWTDHDQINGVSETGVDR